MSAVVEAPLKAVCSSCSRSVKAASGKLPRGWKRRAGVGAVVCDVCWGASYAVRAVTIPLAGPVVEGGQNAVEAAWDVLRGDLHASWAACTQVSNWAVRELAKVEPPRGEKLAKPPLVYLYPGARELAGDFLAPTSVTALLRAVQERYCARRLYAIHRCVESLPSYRYPTPVPCHVQSWSAVALEGGALGVSVQIGAGERAHRWTLRLRGGHQYARQTAAVRQLLAGTALPCELSILEANAHSSDHRVGGETRAPGGAPRRATRILIKIVLWMPIVARERTGTLYLRTSKDCLLTWSLGDGKGDAAARAYRYNADHVRRWVAEHRLRLQRTNDDMKHEKRWPKNVRDAQVAAREPWVEKFGNRMDSLTHEASAMVVRFAERCKVATIIYDDSERGFVESFPWHALKTKLEYKAKATGVVFEESTAASGEAPTTVVGSLAATEIASRPTGRKARATDRPSASKGGPPCAPHRSRNAD